MTDIAINAADRTFDISLQDGDIKSDDGLRTAVLISLFTDARARADDAIPDGTTNRRGCWQDTIKPVGSRLWLLSRAKELPSTLDAAVGYCEEALAWLIEDKVTSTVEVTTDWQSRGVMRIHTVIHRQDGSVYDDYFLYEMETY